MRSLFIVTAALFASGCSFSWDADVDTDCGEFRTWYRDADGDRWGVAGDFQDACEPEGEFTARNDRDCDDADPRNTGRVGSICPDQLVAVQAGGGTEFVGVTVSGSEAVLVNGSTPLVWARAAEDACGGVGWGGSLLSMTDASRVITALDALPASAEVWAGYVGVRFDPAQPYPSGTAVGDTPPTPGQWVFADGTPVPESRLCSFNGNHGADSSDYDPQLGFLALIKDRPPLEGDGSSSDFCYGTPDEAIPAGGCTAGVTCYTAAEAHFACQRTVPDPGTYAL